MKKTATPRHGAFTLIEMLVVLAIIGILAAILFPAFSRAQESGRQTNCTSNLNQIYIAVNQYFQDTRRYPDSLVDLLPEGANYDGSTTSDTSPAGAPITPVSTIAPGKGTDYLKGGADILLCPDDEVSDRPKSSYGALTKSPIPPYTATGLPATADAGRYVFNYWGYRKDGFVLSSPAGVKAEIDTGSGKVILRDPITTVAYDPANPLQNPVKYSLSNRYAPTSTIITHCVYHRSSTANDLALPTDLYQTPTPIAGDGKGARDIILRLDGTAKVVDVSTPAWNTVNGTTQPLWQIQR